MEGSPCDSRWQLTEAYYGQESGNWLNEGKCYATAGEGRGKAFISASGADLKYGTLSGLSVTGLQSGDALVFSVPMESLDAGTDVSFMATIGITSNNAPLEWVFEHKEGSEWKQGRGFKTLAGESNHSSFVENFSIAEAIKNDTLRIRCRVTAGGSKDGTVFFAPVNYESCRILTYPSGKYPISKDSRKVLALGNSFSYYFAPVWMLQEIARSQGHTIDLRMNVKGSQTFSNHLSLTLSKAAVEEGGYDAAFLQDQSTQHSNYYKNPSSSSSAAILENTENLVESIKKNSSGCKIILENTWSYATSNYAGFGNYEDFDTALQGGCSAIAAEVGADVSPIGKAFAAARSAGYTLYYTDDKHQSEYGAYLKACVNYLCLFGGDFTETVSDCNLPSKAAQGLRTIAENTISNK